MKSTADSLRAGEAASKSVGGASPEERPPLLRHAQKTERVKAAEGRRAGDHRGAPGDLECHRGRGARAGERGRLRGARRRRRAQLPREPRTTWSSAKVAGPDRHAARRQVSGSRFYFLTGRVLCCSLDCCSWLKLAIDNGCPGPAGAGCAQVMVGTGFWAPTPRRCTG